jgi:heme-degrading monooxygenase HmoA
VTLINPFEGAPGRKEDAVAYWNRCANLLRRQPGFISAVCTVRSCLEHASRWSR